MDRTQKYRKRKLWDILKHLLTNFILTDQNALIFKEFFISTNGEYDLGPKPGLLPIFINKVFLVYVLLCLPIMYALIL